MRARHATPVISRRSTRIRALACLFAIVGLVAGSGAVFAYTVQPGDTLSGIAASHGVSSWKTVWTANPGLRNPNLIFPGQILRLPASGRLSPAARPAPRQAAARACLPVARSVKTAGFGQAGSRWARRHTGQDFAAATGTGVRAAAAGTVSSTGWAGAYGNQVQVRHGRGTVTTYSHLSRISVRPGARVGACAQVGRIGTTGNSTGPHLHFEVRLGGTPVNPMPWLRARGLRP